MDKPILLKDEHINLKELKQVCQEYIDFIDNEYTVDNEFDKEIFEAALEAVFGSDVWEYTSKSSEL